MSFSRGQQPEFRDLVKEAWAAHRRANPHVPSDRVAQRNWYEAELEACVGTHTTTALNTGRDYERVMAHFEAIAGTSIRWQMKVHGGDARRILHNVRKAVADFDVSEEYMLTMARKALGYAPDAPIELAQLQPQQLTIIMGELKRFARRQAANLTPSHSSHHSHTASEDPF